MPKTVDWKNPKAGYVCEKHQHQIPRIVPSKATKSGFIRRCPICDPGTGARRIQPNNPTRDYKCRKHGPTEPIIYQTPKRLYRYCKICLAKRNKLKPACD